MVNKIIIAVLLLLNVFVGYEIYNSIKADVDYTAKVREIDLAVIARLQDVQKAQIAFKDMKGYFTSSFDTLSMFLTQEKFMKIRSVGDLDRDSSAGLSIDTVYVDPIAEFFEPDFRVSTLGKVPPADTAYFIMQSGFIIKNELQVPVYEAIDPYPFNKTRTLKVGSMTDAVYSGNWK
jgi:hypothetical protein